MKTEQEIVNEIENLRKKCDEISDAIEEESFPLHEQVAGAVKKLILASRMSALAWVLGGPTEEFEDYVKEGEGKILNSVKSLIRHFN